MINRIENTGSTPFDCQCLLHTYYSVPSISTTTVSGLKGYTGVESVTTGKRRGFYSFFCFYYRICWKWRKYFFCKWNWCEIPECQ